MRIILGTACCMAALSIPVSTFGQGVANYPTKPITVILPTEPGVTIDGETRAWTDLMAENIGQKFVRDYKPGASTYLGLAYVAKAKPDGYILGMGTINLPLAPLRYDDPPFDSINSFEQISMLSKRLSAILVSTQFPISNIKEYIAYARANPGVLNWAASGEGSIDHIVGAWLMSATNTKVNFIHYKDSKSSQVDLLAGRVHMVSNSINTEGTYTIFMKSGKLRNIGTAALQRSPLEPDVPTLVEQGIPDFEAPSFLDFLAPAKTPAAVIAKLRAEVVRVSKLPELQQRIGRGTVILASTPAEARQMLQGYTDRFRKVAQENNINMKGN